MMKVFPTPLISNANSNNPTRRKCNWWQGASLRAVVLAEGSEDIRAYPETLRVRGQGVGLGRLPIVQPMLGTPFPGTTWDYLSCRRIHP